MKLFKGSRVKISTAAVIFALPIIFFQNCSDVGFKDIPLNTAEQALQKPRITINNGAPYTRDTGVMVQLNCYGGKEMYLTSDPTCADGGQWEPYQSERGWVLSEENQMAEVYAKFKRIDVRGREELTECVSASILHDNIPPTVTYDNAPAVMTQEQGGRFEFTAKDSGSGVEKVSCQLDGGALQDCDRFMDVKDLMEGTHRFALRAVDKAGNVSDPIEYPWLIDRTKPTVAILDPKPAALSTTANATFNFSADDAGSAVAKIYCSINNEAPAECQSPYVRTNLPDGQIRFSVYAVDNVGLTSDVAIYDWVIDTVPSGAFEILGITGAKDTKLDEYLAGDVYPKVNWSQSQDAVRYDVAIMSADGTQVVCAPVSVTTLSHQFGANCALVNGVMYRADVTSYDAAGNSTKAPQFPFTVDIEGPNIVLQQPVAAIDHKSVTIDFSVTDLISGVDTATCLHTYNNMTLPYNCKDRTQIALNNLLPGAHKFEIEATDRAGNMAKSPAVNFTLEDRVLENQMVTVEAPVSKIDVLMVIDNSASMDEERKQLSTKLADFIGVLNEYDWRICLTTTSPVNDGALRAFANNVYAIDKNTPNYNTLFLNLVRGNLGNTSGDEQGIYATVRAIEQKDSRCFRDDAAMATVLISDEDERSWGGYPEYKGQNQFQELGEKNKPQNVLNTIKSVFGEKKIFTFHSIVIKYQDSACLAASKGKYGRRYEELSALTNGIVGSICSPNYSVELAAMGERTKANLDTISLKCEPVAGSLKVTLNPAISGQSYNVMGNKLTFNPRLPEGTQVNLEYYCVKQ